MPVYLTLLPQGTATFPPTASPVHVTLTDLGGCPAEFRDYGLYEEGDRVSINKVVVECMSWPNSLYCSQTGFEPSLLPTSDNNWKHAWKVVGYCSDTIAPNSSPLGGCPDEWAFGNHQTYKENDQVSVTISTTPVKVQAIFKCKPWPYSSFCSMLSPIDTAGGQMGWTYGGDCTGTYTPTSGPTFDPLTVIDGGCPNEFSISTNSPSYKAGSKVSKTISTTPLQKVIYQCREWPNSMYCDKIAFAPGQQYGYFAWTLLGPCDGTMAPTNPLIPTSAPTNVPTPTKAPTNTPTSALTTIAPTPTKAPTNAPTQTAAPTNGPTQTNAPTNAPTQSSAPTNAPTPATASPSRFPTAAPSFPSWGATLEIWTNIEGNTIPNLREGTNNLANAPNQSTRLSGSVLEVPPNTINADNLGVRMSGWLVPPTTGNYKFWIAADSQGELWLSSNGNKANKEKICQVSTTVSSRQWTMYSEQASAIIPLVANQAYYYEVRPSSPCCLKSSHWKATRSLSSSLRLISLQSSPSLLTLNLSSPYWTGPHEGRCWGGTFVNSLGVHQRIK